MPATTSAATVMTTNSSTLAISESIANVPSTSTLMWTQSQPVLVSIAHSSYASLVNLSNFGRRTSVRIPHVHLSHPPSLSHRSRTFTYYMGLFSRMRIHDGEIHRSVDTSSISCTPNNSPISSPTNPPAANVVATSSIVTPIDSASPSLSCSQCHRTCTPVTGPVATKFGVWNGLVGHLRVHCAANAAAPPCVAEIASNSATATFTTSTTATNGEQTPDAPSTVITSTIDTANPKLTATTITTTCTTGKDRTDAPQPITTATIAA
nr:unnamed protein product [Spirometra erinaceieuropaei]